MSSEYDVVGVGEDRFLDYGGHRCENLGANFYLHRGKIFDKEVGRSAE